MGGLPCTEEEELMIEEEIEIATADGTVDAVLVRPDGGKRLPGVLQLPDIGGVREVQRQMARRLASVGYTVLLPNVFYRTSRSPVWSGPRNLAEESGKKRFAELASPLTAEAAERDAAAYVDFLAAHPAVSEGKMGAVGYCITGAMALRAAAVRPDRIAAVASFHGGRLWTEAPSSPHRVLPRVTAQLHFGHAVDDSSMPAEAIEQLDRALTAWGGGFESEIYAGAHHGWTLADNAAYNPTQAERAFTKLSGLLAATVAA
jgi:carboxymethylenebutenolidase